MRKILFALTMLGLVSCEDTTNVPEPIELEAVPVSEGRTKRVVRYINNDGKLGNKVVRYVDTLFVVGDTASLNGMPAIIVK